MSHKANPRVLRLGINYTSENSWFVVKKDYGNMIEDFVQTKKIIEHFMKQKSTKKPSKKMKKIEKSAATQVIKTNEVKTDESTIKRKAPVARIDKNLYSNLYSHLSMSSNLKTNTITLHTHKSSVLAEFIDTLQEQVSKKTQKPVDIRMKNITNPDIDPILISRRIGEMLSKRKDVRRLIQEIMNEALKSASGIFIQMKGRIRGAEIARTQKKYQGTLKRNTFKANVSMHTEHISTKSGMIGVRVEIQKGDII
jgi:ribosomal protein S3